MRPCNADFQRFLCICVFSLRSVILTFCTILFLQFTKHPNFLDFLKVVFNVSPVRKSHHTVGVSSESKCLTWLFHSWRFSGYSVGNFLQGDPPMEQLLKKSTMCRSFLFCSVPFFKCIAGLLHACMKQSFLDMCPASVLFNTY